MADNQRERERRQSEGMLVISKKETGKGRARENTIKRKGKRRRESDRRVREQREKGRSGGVRRRER